MHHLTFHLMERSKPMYENFAKALAPRRAKITALNSIEVFNALQEMQDECEELLDIYGLPHGRKPHYYINWELEPVIDIRPEWNETLDFSDTIDLPADYLSMYSHNAITVRLNLKREVKGITLRVEYQASARIPEDYQQTLRMLGKIKTEYHEGYTEEYVSCSI